MFKFLKKLCFWRRAPKPRAPYLDRETFVSENPSVYVTRGGEISTPTSRAPSVSYLELIGKEHVEPHGPMGPDHI